MADAVHRLVVQPTANELRYSAAMSSLLTPDELARYSRHLRLADFGLDAQQKLRAARVAVVGAGGLGSPALLYLAAAGIGQLGIIEYDNVDLSNLQRQVLYDTASINTSKAQQAQQRLLALNPHVQITLHQQPLAADNIMDILRHYDVVLDGTDQFGVRYLINDACVLLRKPLVSAAIHRFEGQAFTYVPGNSPCYRCLFAEPPEAGAVPNCAEAGVLGVLPGVMGTIQATEAIKIITGLGELLTGRLLTYDALDMRFAEFRFARRDDCAVCGTQPTIHAPVMQEANCATTSMPTISARELRARLDTDALLLLDVREPHEFAAGHLPDAINLPLGQVAKQAQALAQDREWIVMCRAGGRSAQACEVLIKQLPTVALHNLQGGLLAWQREVDASITVV